MMKMEFWDYLKNLFKKAEESSPAQPLIHEVIERSEAERQDYLHWRETLVRRRLQDWLNNQYSIFRVTPDNIDEALDFLDTPSSKGFVIYFFKTRYSERDIMHFFDFLKEQVLTLDYRTQVSDRRTYNRPQWVETVQRHYLKPKPDFMREGKFEQKYGNIMIEMESRDEQVHNLRFRATSYRDHLFKDAHDFKDLMQMILV